MLSSPSSPLVTRGPFAGDEEEHLAEGDGHQREIDAAPMRDEAARPRRRRRPPTSVAISKPTHRFGHEVELRQAHRIGADAEEGAVSERRQAGVAEQHVEAEREDAPDQHLDAEIGVEADLL